MNERLPKSNEPESREPIDLTGDERSKNLIRNDLRRQWVEYLSHPTIQHSLNLRVDVTFKQRRNSDLRTRRPADSVTVRYERCPDEPTFVPDIGSIVPVKRFQIVEIDRDRTVDVRVQQRPLSLSDAALVAPYYYLTEDETRRIMIRVVNRLNKELFGHAARRTTDRQRLTALVCQHDRDTRRRVHCLFGVPNVPLSTFVAAFHRACRTEPFLHRLRRIEPVENLAGAILYNLNDGKTLFGTSILYLHPQPDTNATPKETHDEHHDDAATLDQHDIRPAHA